MIEALEVREPKTKLFNTVLNAVLPKRGRVLIIDDTFENNAAWLHATLTESPSLKPAT